MNIVTMVNPSKAEDSEEEEQVEVKTVKYRELVQQAERREEKGDEEGANNVQGIETEKRLEA